MVHYRVFEFMQVLVARTVVLAGRSGSEATDYRGGGKPVRRDLPPALVAETAGEASA